jgi:hypothetical protein
MMFLKMACGDEFMVITTGMQEGVIIPPDIPYVFYPLDDDNSIDVGDIMTCIICMENTTIEGIS